MANTDFFDDDLVKQRDTARRLKLGPADEPIGTLSDSGASDEVPVRPVSDFNLTRMAKHKQEVDNHMATAVQELERLRKRQEDLEREKRELEELRRKNDEYERGKREMVERLSQSLVTLEKDELQAERLSELLGATRKRFKTMLGEIQSLNDEAWPENQVRDELNKALVILEDARMEYNKSMSKIDAVGGAAKKAASGEHAPVIFEETGAAVHHEEHGFAYWVKVGFAVTLPLIAVIVVLTVVFMVLQANALL